MGAGPRQMRGKRQVEAVAEVVNELLFVRQIEIYKYTNVGR
jgi:hypothetical protein